MSKAARIVPLLLLALLGCRGTPTAPVAAPAPWAAIGHSYESRPIRATTRGRGPLRVYLIGSIHGDEPEGLAAVETLAAQLGSPSSPATARIVLDANPDGTAARTRTNARGRDLNRNWPAANFRSHTRHGESALSEPEAAAVHADLLAFRPDLVIVFHSSRSGPFVNFDGPALPHAKAFASAAAATDPRWRVVPHMGYATPGSLGSYIGVDRNIPILTIEFRRGQSAQSVLAAATTGIKATLRPGSPAAAAAAAGTSATATPTPSGRTGTPAATAR